MLDQQLNCIHNFTNTDELSLYNLSIFVFSQDYKPSQQDILYSRKATRGIVEDIIDINRVPFRFVDVGGQRSERQKWYQCFSRVTAILFLVSSSAFDQFLQEDRVTNRMVESSGIFDTIVNHKYFSRVAVILFLNKTDLLEEKVKKGVNIKEWFQGFQGDPRSIQDVQKFILAMFDSRRQDRSKPLFSHYTTAVDTNNIKRVFDSVHDIILEEHLRSTLGQGSPENDGIPY